MAGAVAPAFTVAQAQATHARDSLTPRTLVGVSPVGLEGRRRTWKASRPLSCMAPHCSCFALLLGISAPRDDQTTEMGIRAHALPRSWSWSRPGSAWVITITGVVHAMMSVPGGGYEVTLDGVKAKWMGLPKFDGTNGANPAQASPASN